MAVGLNISDAYTTQAPWDQAARFPKMRREQILGFVRLKGDWTHQNSGITEAHCLVNSQLKVR